MGFELNHAEDVRAAPVVDREAVRGLPRLRRVVLVVLPAAPDETCAGADE